jgi:hypothetical protein
MNPTVSITLAKFVGSSQTGSQKKNTQDFTCEMAGQ